MKKKILIADDDPEVRDFFGDILAEAGYETACCERGGDVEKIIAGFSPDLLLLDAMLPGVDGLTLAYRIAGNPATAALPIIVVTGLGSAITAFNKFPQVKALMHKPVAHEELLENIGKALQIS
ncbi:MAG: response regulator [Elusimicrobiales bacterium]|nr:response regulator [Elusimicrobiales bacterium]